MEYIKNGNKKPIKLNENDIIIIVLFLITLFLVFLLYNYNQNLNTMINIFNQYCYVSPKTPSVFNISNLGV